MAHTHGLGLTNKHQFFSENWWALRFIGVLAIWFADPGGAQGLLVMTQLPDGPHYRTGSPRPHHGTPTTFHPHNARINKGNRLNFGLLHLLSLANTVEALCNHFLRLFNHGGRV